MSQPTQYQLLKDTHQMVSDLRKETNARMVKIEDRVDNNEGKIDNLLGKIGIGIMVLSALISGGVTIVVNWFKDKI